jgi:hypothetical protein
MLIFSCTRHSLIFAFCSFAFYYWRIKFYQDRQNRKGVANVSVKCSLKR